MIKSMSSFETSTMSATLRPILAVPDFAISNLAPRMENSMSLPLVPDIILGKDNSPVAKKT
jgi:hypothetical protein